jgi:7 transmembrane sweet-taste receptor of 3 GCPR
MMFGILFSLNFVVLLTWTLVSPLEWTRTPLESTDIFDRAVASYGSCSNEDALPFYIVMVVINVGFLILANWWAFESRNIETEYRESRYIAVSLASVLQAWCMGVPIMIVVQEYPSAKFFVEAGIVFVTALAVLLLVYVPKALAIHADHIQRMNKHSSRINHFAEDDNSDEKLGAKNSCGSDGSDERKPTNSPSAGMPKDSYYTCATTSSKLMKLTGKENDDEAVAVAAIAVASAQTLSNGSLICHGVFELESDNSSERIGGIKVLHLPRVR